MWLLPVFFRFYLRYHMNVTFSVYASSCRLLVDSYFRHGSTKRHKSYLYRLGNIDNRNCSLSRTFAPHDRSINPTSTQNMIVYAT